MLIDGQTMDQGTRSCVERLLVKVIGSWCPPVMARKDHGPIHPPLEASCRYQARDTRRGILPQRHLQE
jgi:hypothetical protein